MRFKIFTKNYRPALREASSKDEKTNLESFIFPLCRPVIETSKEATALNKNIQALIKNLDSFLPLITTNDSSILKVIYNKIDALKELVDKAHENKDTFTGIFQQLNIIIEKILNYPLNDQQQNTEIIKLVKILEQQYIIPIKDALNKIQMTLNNFIYAFPVTSEEDYLKKFDIEPNENIFIENEATDNLKDTILNFTQNFNPIKQTIQNINYKIRLLLDTFATGTTEKNIRFINIVTENKNFLDTINNTDDLVQEINNLLELNKDAAKENSDFIIAEVNTYIHQVINKTNVGKGKVYQKLSTALNAGLGYDSDEIKMAWNDYLQSTACKKIPFFGKNVDYLEAIRTALLFEIKFFKSELIEENPFIEYLSKLGTKLNEHKPTKLNPDYFRNTYNVIHNAVQRGNLTKQDLTTGGTLEQNNLIFNPELFTYVNSKDYLEYQDLLIKLAADNFNALTSDGAQAEYIDIYNFIIGKLKTVGTPLGEKISYFMGLPNLQNFLASYRRTLTNKQLQKATARQILISKLSAINKLQDISTIRENLELLMGQSNYNNQRSAISASWKNDNNKVAAENALFQQQLNPINFNKNLQKLVSNKEVSRNKAYLNIIAFILYQYYKKNPSKAGAMRNFENIIPQLFKNTQPLKPQNLFNALIKNQLISSDADIQAIKKQYQELLKYSYQNWFQLEAEQDNKDLISLFDTLGIKAKTENDNKDKK